MQIKGRIINKLPEQTRSIIKRIEYKNDKEINNILH